MQGKTIHAKYFDGKSSKSNTVEVFLSVKSLIITNIDNSIEERWNIEDINNLDFSGSQTLQLKFGEFPQKTLVIAGKEEFGLFKEFYPELFNKNIYNKVLKSNSFKVIGLSLVVLISLLALYFLYIGPFVAEKVAGLIPQKEEILLGDKMFESIKQIMDIDSVKTNELNRFYNSIGFESDYPIHLYYADESIVNAFAIPGGKIVVYRGLIDKMDSWKQLAGLISHELAHVEKRHSIKSMSRNLSTYFVIAIITTDISGITSVFIENAFKLQELSHSRTFEQEADDIGFQFLLDRDIDPQGMYDLFEVLKGQEVFNISDKNKKYLKLLSTHPLTDERMKNIRNKINGLSNTSFIENKKAQNIFNNLKGDE